MCMCLEQLDVFHTALDLTIVNFFKVPNCQRRSFRSTRLDVLSIGENGRLKILKNKCRISPMDRFYHSQARHIYTEEEGGRGTSPQKVLPGIPTNMLFVFFNKIYRCINNAQLQVPINPLNISTRWLRNVLLP
jgi:hypothetical protein